jgi:hypothetical protein
MKKKLGRPKGIPMSDAQKVTSRLSAFCVSCKHTGSRDVFTANPMLAEDECPNCRSDDIDIFDSKHSAAGDYSYDMREIEKN